uniref:TPM_phosphatase domain-containing protein n=1 Tax=Steinernema glaseri TaxID=37863 RepID=A0A1I7ZTS8_9BILA
MFFAFICSVVLLAPNVRSQCPEAQEGERLRDTSTSVVEGNAESTLIQTLKSYADRLDSASRPEFDLLIVDLNNRVVSNESLPMTSVVTVSAYRLLDYLDRHAEQREEVEDMRVGTWGSIRDLFVVGARMKAESVGSVVSEVNGKYALLEALEEAKSTFPNQVERTRIDELISDLESQVGITDVPLATQMAQIHQVFSEWNSRWVLGVFCTV